MAVDPAPWDALATELARTHVPVPGTCGRVACESGWTWRPTLRDYDLWLVLDGRAHGSINGAPETLQAHSLLMFRPGDIVEFRQDPSARLIVAFCHFTFVEPATWQPASNTPAWLPARHIRLSDSGKVSASLHRIVRLSRERHPLRRLEAESILRTALIDVYVQDAAVRGHTIAAIDPRLQTVVDHLAERPQHRVSLDQAARIAGVSAAHLSRMFSRQLGVSYRSFVVEARLERACSLLTDTSLTVTEIAKALGYTDAFLLSRQFRSRYGTSPRAFRHSAAT